MASFVVRVERIRDILSAWQAQMAKIYGPPTCNPGRLGLIKIQWTDRHKLGSLSHPYFKMKKELVQGFDEDRWDRIQWFYYCDNDYGNTLRLYDSEHLASSNPRQTYLELRNQRGGRRVDDRVIFRGENLGGESESLKDFFRNTFSDYWPAGAAPSETRPPWTRVIDVMGMYCEDRTHYFETKNRALGTP